MILRSNSAIVGLSLYFIVEACLDLTKQHLQLETPLKGLKNVGLSASKATDHDVVGDETENNSANLQTLVVKNQHINPPEEPELMRREAREAKKGVKLSSCRPKSIKSRPNSPVASTSKDDVIRCSACEEEDCDSPTEEWIQCCKCQEWLHEESSNYENGIFICDYC
ncbi:hypothetical protein TNCV_1423331 [Trichonephila clavipes]|nr:hypothetical protein TNCV_1423331 [Trichonephila clavipes]